eukprot:RCo038327
MAAATVRCSRCQGPHLIAHCPQVTEQNARISEAISATQARPESLPGKKLSNQVFTREGFGSAIPEEAAPAAPPKPELPPRDFSVLANRKDPGGRGGGGRGNQPPPGAARGIPGPMGAMGGPGMPPGAYPPPPGYMMPTDLAQFGGYSGYPPLMQAYNPMRPPAHSHDPAMGYLPPNLTAEQILNAAQEFHGWGGAFPGSMPAPGITYPPTVAQQPPPPPPPPRGVMTMPPPPPPPA